jgi:cardiolipin synthase (CMP-forming)
MVVVAFVHRKEGMPMAQMVVAWVTASWVWSGWVPTVPNYITVLRMLALVPLCCLWLAGLQLAAVVLYAAAAVSDILDGWLSRLLGQETVWGKRMDPLADKVFVYGVSLLLVFQLWPHLLAVVLLIAVRDADVERLRDDYPVKAEEVKTVFLAKVKTWFFMVGLGCLMAVGSTLDQLPVSAELLAYGSFGIALVCALISWVQYHGLYRDKPKDSF